MAEDNTLVLAYGYLIDYCSDPNADAFGVISDRVTPGYYVGSTTESPGGAFRDLNNLEAACAEAALACKVWSVPVDMNFEGFVKTKTMALLLQPIQENPADYKSVEELAQEYLIPLLPRQLPS